MIRNNPRAARVAAFGDWGSAEDIIYDNWEEIDFDIPSLKARQDVKFVYGLDFGYATSYNAFVAAAIEPLTHTMWIFDEMYEKGMTNIDIARRITEKGYSKEVIYADSAEPKSIYELQQGLLELQEYEGETITVRYALPNIRAALKGPDSVANGIAKVQEYHIYVHPLCRNTIRELQNYAWAKDKDGRLTGKPEKEFDHLCDALRYSLSGELLKGHGGVVEAKGMEHHHVMRVASSEPEPVNTLRQRQVVQAIGPADAAPTKKRTVRIFSSVKAD